MGSHIMHQNFFTRLYGITFPRSNIDHKKLLHFHLSWFNCESETNDWWMYGYHVTLQGSDPMIEGM